MEILKILSKSKSSKIFKISIQVVFLDQPFATNIGIGHADMNFLPRAKRPFDKDKLGAIFACWKMGGEEWKDHQQQKEHMRR